MLCTNCKERPSLMHYVSIINGVKTERYLCAECAQKMGMPSFSPFSWGDMLIHTMPTVEQAHCSQCGMTLAEFKQSGMIGCEHCYTDLRSGIEPILRRVQKGIVHSGRTPIGFEAAKLPIPGQSKIHEPTEREKLQEQLREAVEKEEFETAAQLRDQIKSLDSEV